MNDISTMTEKELKNKVNEYRTEISHNEHALKSAFKDLRLHRTNVDELKEKRDELNAKVRQLAGKAREEKKQRDAANVKIADLKSARDCIRKEQDYVTSDIAQMKAKRDEFNKLSKGSVESLSKAYAGELDKFLNGDIPLEHEIDIFGRLTQLQNRLEAASSADEVHNNILQAYKSSKGVYDAGGDIGAQIHTLADESQKHHLAMISLYKEVDDYRKEADNYHSQIIDTYKVQAPIREKIDPLKEKISQLRDELSVYLDKLNGIQLEKDDIKEEEKHNVAKEKFEKTGKMSLDELRILMEKGDLKL